LKHLVDSLFEEATVGAQRIPAWSGSGDTSTAHYHVQMGSSWNAGLKRGTLDLFIYVLFFRIKSVLVDFFAAKVGEIFLSSKLFRPL
jgi:hypothetical protein